MTIDFPDNLLALESRAWADIQAGTLTVDTAQAVHAAVGAFAEQAGLFYEYLPYAIVFGATKQWARAFEGLSLPTPSWYGSSQPFTTFLLINALRMRRRSCVHASMPVAVVCWRGCSSCARCRKRAT